MKEQERIPTSRAARTGKFIATGARVGGNYLKHFSKKLVTGKEDRDTLHADNARDIYGALSNLKGSALKVAQMMSMDQGLLPAAYTERFAQAQYSAPPLSYPLVVKTFQQHFGKAPGELFDFFEKKSFAAASIGQVHRAEYRGQKLAVKVQYPGVANSIESDLRMVRPIVSRMFNISQAEMNHYLEEVQDRLLEETDYQLELRRSQEITAACAEIKGLFFPHYYREFSGPRVLTMDWLAGQHLKEFLAEKPSQEVRNQLGQLLWDFYDLQIHELRQVHADPHPGNFLFRADGTLGVLDFGCVKELPEDFYRRYFQIMKPALTDNAAEFNALLRELRFLLPEDKPQEVAHFQEVYRDVLHLLGKPFFTPTFDFADDGFFQEIYQLSDLYQNDKMLRQAKAGRGPRDAIYLNRTYFGLYSILNQLRAKIDSRSRVNRLFKVAS